MSEYIRVTALPGPKAPRNSPPTRMLIRADIVEVVLETPDGGAALEFYSTDQNHLRGVTTVDRYDDVVAQLETTDEMEELRRLNNVPLHTSDGMIEELRQRQIDRMVTPTGRQS